MPQTFGESGQPWELIKYFGLTGEHLAQAALEMVGGRQSLVGTRQHWAARDEYGAGAEQTDQRLG